MDAYEEMNQALKGDCPNEAGMLTDERIVDLRRTTGPASGYTQWADTIGFSRAIEAEVRKEQAEKIAELERQLEAARKDSERLHKFLSGDALTVKMKKSTVVYGPNNEPEFREAFISAIDAASKKDTA